MTKTYTEIWDDAVEETADILVGSYSIDATKLARVKLYEWACIAAKLTAAWKLWSSSPAISAAVIAATIYELAQNITQTKLIHAVRDRNLLQRRTPKDTQR